MALFALVLKAQAQEPGPGPNGLARTPPMGWMSWERFRCETDCKKFPNACINEDLYRAMADRLASDGYLEAGYKTVSIDDCWANNTRDAKGVMIPNPQRFPSGMKALGDYMHSKNVFFGIYSDEGTLTCGGYPGSVNYEELDALTFASWGVDYLKLDGCYNSLPGLAAGYPRMGYALRATKRDIVYSCSWPAYIGDDETSKPFAKMVDAGCNLWRNWDDIDNNWRSIRSIIDHWGNYTQALQAAVAPGHWNDMDMILCGNDHYGKLLTLDECQTQLSIWSITASPLIMSNDLRTVPAIYKEALLDKELIGINQDPLGKAGGRISPFGEQEVWARPLDPKSGHAVAVALLNKGEKPADISFNFTDVGFPGTTARVRDVWKKQETVSTGPSYTATAVAPHAVALLLLV